MALNPCFMGDILGVCGDYSMNDEIILLFDEIFS